MAIYIKPQTIAESNITVTSTSTKLFALIATAGSTTEEAVRAYYNNKGANAVVLYCEDGAIRYGLDVTPTSSAGILIAQGTYVYLSGVSLENLNLIRTSGDVKVSVQIIKETQ